MSIVTATIKSKGKKLKAAYHLIGIDIQQEVNRIPFAQLVLLDGDAASRSFPLSEEEFFTPGNEVEIQLRYEEGKKAAQQVFKGLVMKHALESDGMNSTLRVELKGPAYAMTQGRKSVVHQGTDKSILTKLIQAANLQADIKGADQPKHAEMVQYYCSDWDFLLSRAEAQNLLVVANDRKVSLHAPEPAGKAVHSFEYGIDDIYAFSMEADASNQFSGINSLAWDNKKNALTKAAKGAEFNLKQGNLEADKLAKRVGGQAYSLRSVVPMHPEEIQSWADSRMARTRLSMLRGHLSVPGFASIQLLDTIAIKGMGARFNGTTRVMGFRHQVDLDGWQTHIQFGLSAAPFALTPDILDAPAAGLVPAIQGLQLGTVEGFKKDTEEQFRIRIKLPCVDQESGMVWARLAMPEAGKERGFMFLPEKGDEVVVGFLNDDPRQAIILGSLYSSTNRPPKDWEKWDRDNIFKGIVTKTGIRLAIDDKEGSLSLITSDKQSIILNEKTKSIEIVDLNNNKITLGKKGMVIKVSDKLSIQALGDIEMTGNNIKLNATAKLELKGSQVEIK